MDAQKRIMQLMEERGYDALTVNDLCERADTSRGSFYNHFRDKDGLLAVLEDEVMADLDALQGRMQSITLADMLAFRATGRPLPFLVELFALLLPILAQLGALKAQPARGSCGGNVLRAVAGILGIELHVRHGLPSWFSYRTRTIMPPQTSQMGLNVQLSSSRCVSLMLR